jgi:hypothetical protein
MFKLVVLFIALVSGVCCSASAQEKNKDKIDEFRQKGYTVQAVTPIFSQLVLLSFPKGFKGASEQTNDAGNFYVQESVLEGETTARWSQMITVTGAKGLSANPNLSPQSYAEQIASGFKRACPFTFFTKGFGAIKISGQDAFVALASCGTAPSGADKHSETALVIAIQGAADYYTIQWAERGPPSDQPLTPDDATWMDRFKKLNPIKICPRVAGEAAPYPSCMNQK